MPATRPLLTRRLAETECHGNRLAYGAAHDGERRDGSRAQIEGDNADDVVGVPHRLSVDRDDDVASALQVTVAERFDGRRAPAQPGGGPRTGLDVLDQRPVRHFVMEHPREGRRHVLCRNADVRVVDVALAEQLRHGVLRRVDRNSETYTAVVPRSGLAPDLRV